MENQEFHDRLVQLHSARLGVLSNAVRKKALLDAFNATHADLWEWMALRKEAVERMEDVVRIEALTLYKTIPNASKTFLPGVTIREVQVVEYDPSAALQWALAHGGVALVLNDGAYKKLVGMAGIDAPGQVTLNLTVALARDLAPILEAQP